MKNKMKIAVLMICVCVFMSGMTAFADSTQYTITVNSSGTNEDNISKRTIKNTSGYVQFCVTPSYFDTSNAGFFATSIQLYGTAKSSMIYVENGIGEPRYGSYINNNAPINQYYFMEAKYGYSSTGSVTSRGKYTP